MNPWAQVLRSYFVVLQETHEVLDVLELKPWMQNVSWRTKQEQNKNKELSTRSV